MKRIFTLLILFASACLCAAQNSLTVDAPRVVSIDETFRVVFTADGKMSDFNWECSDDFTIAWGPQRGSMSSTTIVNGKRTSSHQETCTYLLQAKKEGRFDLPGATATIDKTTCTSNPFTIEVVRSQQAAQGQMQSQNQNRPQDDNYDSNPATSVSSDEDIFVRMTLNKTSVVKGEPLIATLKLYTRVDIAGFEEVHFPTFNGFWSKEIDTPQNIEFNRENVNGTIYSAALLRRYMLIPQKTGQIAIDPAEMVCQIRVRSSSAGRSVFDDFFDSYQTVRKRLSTPELRVNVRNLPAGAPVSFAGGVGNFTMTTKLSKDDIKSHEAVSLIVNISGKGNISMLEAPKFDFPSDFEVYDIKTTDNISADGTSGSRTFEFPFIPRSHGDFTIGPIQYSYYDIQKGSYQTLSSGDINISITKGDDVDGGGVVMPGITRQGVKNLAEDIRYIKTGNAGLKENGRFFAGSIVFYILAAILVALFFVISALMQKIEARRSDVVGSRNRKANKMARTRLHQAGEYMKNSLPGAFYEEMHKAILGYVSDKLIIPVADLSRDRISEVLAQKGAGEAVIADLNSIIDACEFARYAPDADHSAMEKHYEEAVRVISQLESTMKNSSKSSRKGPAAVAILLMFTLSAQAQDVSNLWRQGNDAYSSGDWSSAINFYKAIEGENLVSPDLYYNLGNTYFKQGDNPHAILYYEKCLKLNPSHGDALNNLQIARQFTMDKIDVVPDFILVTWCRDIKYRASADGWGWISLVLIALAVALLLVFKFAGNTAARKVSFIFACIAALFALFAFFFSISEKSDAIKSDQAIIMQPVVNVKSSPGDAGKSIFVIHEGTKVNILDELGDWTNVEISDGRQGWLQNSQIESI